MPFLDWVNKRQATRSAQDVPYHLLRQVSAHGDTTGAYADNLLVQGDNLLALKALLPFYRGQVKCIFIDPPYNTQSAFEHYDDRLEHSQWLSMMYPRLVLLRELLAENGSIWVTLDDNEAHYCKVLMDEVFGRQNFVANVVWQHSVQPKNDAKLISLHHNHLLTYRKSSSFQRKQLARTEEHNVNYRNPDNDPRGLWRSGDFRSPNRRTNLIYVVKTPSGKVIAAPEKGWRWSKEKFQEKVDSGEIIFVDDESRVLRKIYLSDQQGRVPESIWFGQEVGTTREASNHVSALFVSGSVFDTPKPERLIQRILEIATNPDDLVLDSFLGSGTTAAVAHKMGRRYIGIEMGEHAQTHCLPRLQKVLEGEQGGISAQVGWQGGGGFRFCKVGSAVFDAFGAIHPDVKFNALAAYLWHFETGTPGKARYDKPRLGTHQGTAYYLLFNGILGDRRPEGGNVLTLAVLQMIEEAMTHAGPKVIYGETTSLGPARLARLGIRFKQIPYDLPLR
jgi:adenine-specific DNA-methyltransferase